MLSLSLATCDVLRCCAGVHTVYDAGQRTWHRGFGATRPTNPDHFTRLPSNLFNFLSILGQIDISRREELLGIGLVYRGAGNASMESWKMECSPP